MTDSDTRTATLPLALRAPAPGRPRVNLLPTRVRDAHAAKRMRISAIALVGFAVLLVGAMFGVGVVHQGMADNALSAQTDRQTALLAEQRGYAEIAGILDDTRLAETRLADLLADDVAPAQLTLALREALPDGSTLTGIRVTTPGADDGGTSAPGGPSATLDDSGETAIGVIELTGTGRTQTEVDAYIAAIAEIDGLRVPYLQSTRSLDDDRGLAFTARATVTDVARTGRFATGDEG